MNKNGKNKILIGITGGIGSGKSEVTKYLRSLGEYVICADEVSRQIVMTGEEGAMALRLAFGDGVFLKDGSLNRKKLADEVFSNDKRLELLNDTLHPLILKRIDCLAQQKQGRVFIDAALLIQTGMYKTVDIIWLVVAGLNTRIARVVKRDGLSAAEVEQRIKGQISDEEMSQFADVIIRNDGSLSALKRDVDGLLNTLKNAR
jgi:dephospho-CoA kinase